MARYEFSEGTSNKCWEIEVKGSSYTVKWGKIGGSTSISTKACGSPAAAQKAADKLIGEKTEKGYTLVGENKPAKQAPAAAKPARNKDLEKQIAANPDDPEPYLVYADWLQTEGDARGELVVLQHGKKTKQATALLEKHPELLGSFAVTKPETFELEWFCGHIKKAKLGWPMWDEGDGVDGDACEALLVEFLKLPAAQFLQELELGCIPAEEELNTSYFASAIDKVAPSCLRSLSMMDIGDWDISSTNAAIPESKATKRLQTLRVRGGHITLGQIDLPELREFVVHSGGLTAKELAEIAKAKWPKLEHLEIWCGDPNYGASGGVKELAPIFAATGLAKLHHLAIANCSFADAMVDKLIGSKILPQLRTLDLSRGNLSDRGIDAMVAAKDRFKHLENLDLDDNALTETSKPKVKQLAKKVNYGTQDSPERAVPRTKENQWYRYVAVGE